MGTFNPASKNLDNKVTSEVDLTRGFENFEVRGLVRGMIEYIGENPEREGLIETPERVVKSWKKLYGGYEQDPADVLKIFKDDSSDEMVILKDIEFYSTCVIGSTLIETPSGRIPIEHLKDGDWVYCFDENTEDFTIQKCSNPRLIKRNQKLVEVYCESDTLFCTPEHKILTFKGWKRADDLQPGDRIVSMKRGAIKQDGMRPYLSMSSRKRATPEARFVYECLYGENSDHIHHINRQVWNNDPSNLKGLSSKEHMKFHATVDGAGERLKRSNWTKGQVLKYQKNRAKGFYKFHENKNSEEYKEMIRKRSESVKESWKTRRLAVNHKVIAIKRVSWRSDVWCMDVEKYHNFVAQGMVIHNCEHHLLPFFGKAHIAYIPNGKVVGVSKLARILEIYSRRMQIQERICRQVTEALMKHLNPLGAACMLEAKHFCMTSRGVEKQNSVMVTSSLEGVFRDDPAVKSEFLSLINRG